MGPLCSKPPQTTKVSSFSPRNDSLHVQNKNLTKARVCGRFSNEDKKDVPQTIVKEGETVWEVISVLFPGFLALAFVILAWKYHISAQDWERLSIHFSIAKKEAEICRGGVIGNIIFAVFMAAWAIFNLCT